MTSFRFLALDYLQTLGQVALNISANSVWDNLFDSSTYLSITKLVILDVTKTRNNVIFTLKNHKSLSRSHYLFQDLAAMYIMALMQFAMHCSSRDPRLSLINSVWRESNWWRGDKCLVAYQLAKARCFRSDSFEAEVPSSSLSFCSMRWIIHECQKILG